MSPKVTIAVVVGVVAAFGLMMLFGAGAVVDKNLDRYEVEGTLDGEEIEGVMVCTEAGESSAGKVLRYSFDMSGDTTDAYLFLGPDGMPDPVLNSFVGQRDVNGIMTDAWEAVDQPGVLFCFDGGEVAAVLLTGDGYDCFAIIA